MLSAAVNTGRPLKLLLVLALIVGASFTRKVRALVGPTAETDPSRNIASLYGEPISTASAPTVNFDDWGLEKDTKASLPSYFPLQMPSQALSSSANPSGRPSVQPTDRPSRTP